MRHPAVHKSIIRRPDGQIVFYPWTWRGMGAMTAFAVDSSDVVQSVVRRRNVGSVVAVAWFLLSFPFPQFHQFLLMSFGVFLSWVLAQWVLLGLRGRSAQLPRLSAIRLAAKRRGDTRVEFWQSVYMILITLVLAAFLFRQVWMLVAVVLAVGLGGTNLWVAWSIWQLNRKPDQRIWN